MYGAVIGDIVGSRFEARGTDHKSKDFDFWHDRCGFTDDTVCTVAVADILMNDLDAAVGMQSWCRSYPGRGYGGWFGRWIYSNPPLPYNSFGNGAGMRVSPCAFLSKNDLTAALSDAERVTSITHDHPEGIKGALAVTHSIWLALNDHSPDEIRRTIAEEYCYDMDRSVDEIRPSYRFDVTCQGSVPESIICALESDSFEDGVRNAISIGGDSDTIGAMAGGISEALHGIEDHYVHTARRYLDDRLATVLDAMYFPPEASERDG